MNRKHSIHRYATVSITVALLIAGAPYAVAADSAPAAATVVKQAQPPGPPPERSPPAPAYATPPPPSAQPIEGHPQPPLPSPPPVAAMPTGQWTYTQQYGWLWTPYDQRYTQVVDDAALAYEYVWYPAFGWTWVVAPWVLGLGVTPYWGAGGPVHFAWYAHPWFRVGTAHLHPSWGVGVAPRGAFGRHVGGRGRGWR